MRNEEGKMTISKGGLMAAPTASPARVPLLHNGDHLDRDEFERRYSAMPEVKKAELIEGVVYMPSPLRFAVLVEQHAHLMMWLAVYRAHSPGVRVADNATVRLDLNNEPQPDAVLLINPEQGGRVTFTDHYITGGPELAAEVAASTVSIARNAKLRAYQRNGVQEYLIWRVEDQAIDWFVLRGGQYASLPAGPDGVVRSEVFPGLWLDGAALLAEDLIRVLAVLQQGIASPEHAAFLARLQQAQTP
jgi:Uma2 family endonuclease